MSTPDETTAVRVAIRWGQDYIDVRQGRAALPIQLTAPAPFALGLTRGLIVQRTPDVK